MKNLAKLFMVLFLVTGLILSGCAEKKEKPKKTKAEEKITITAEGPPWDNFGYEKLNQFHLRYYYVFEDALDKALNGEMSWKEAIKDNTGIVEVWFDSQSGLYRLDRYIEKLDAKCKAYEGAPPATLSYNNKTYWLQERLFQRGKKLTRSYFQSGDQIGYDRQTKQAIAKSCRYEKFTILKDEPADQGLALSRMMQGHSSMAGFGFYLTQKLGEEEIDEGVEDLEKATLELTKLTNPSQYKKILEGWKARKKIAGRTAAKKYSAPRTLKVSAGLKGYQFIDLELGIGLEGYLEGCIKSWVYPETKFDEPKLTYKALIVEKAVPPDVFEGF